MMQKTVLSRKIKSKKAKEVDSTDTEEKIKKE